MGKVEIRRNAGTFVARRQPGQPLVIDRPAEVGVDHIRHLCEAREGLECAVVYAVLANAGADLSEARTVLAAAGAKLAGKAKPPGGLDVRFQSALASACANPVLEGPQRAVHEMWIDACVRLGGTVADAPRPHEEHLRVPAAIKAGDTEGPTRLMAKYVNPAAGQPSASIRPKSAPI
jgi:DNA-binding FadR family transcriptional regulator